MNAIWLPEDEEILEILSSTSAKNAYRSGTTMFFSDIRRGQKIRMAFFQEGDCVEVESVQIVAAGSVADLQFILD